MKLKLPYKMDEDGRNKRVEKKKNLGRKWVWLKSGEESFL